MRVSLVTLVTDPALYESSRASLIRQLAEGEVESLAVDANKRGWNAATALNDGIERASGEWVICGHQDVAYPEGWWERVTAQVGQWKGTVGVAGLVGVTRGGAFRGHIIDPHGHCYWGPLPCRVLALDEHALIIRRDTGLRFDPQTPGFHCYGADICLEARRRRLDVIAVDAPVVHHSPGVLDDSFDEASNWLLQKWAQETGGVIPTCAAQLYGGGLSAAARHRVLKIRRRLSVRQGRKSRASFRERYGAA
jgi:hypothetical protein